MSLAKVIAAHELLKANDLTDPEDIHAAMVALLRDRMALLSSYFQWLAIKNTRAKRRPKQRAASNRKRAKTIKRNLSAFSRQRNWQHRADVA